MMEAHLLVIIDRWGKCRLSTVPLKTGNDGTTAGLPQALARRLWHMCTCLVIPNLSSESKSDDVNRRITAVNVYIYLAIRIADCKRDVRAL